MSDSVRIRRLRTVTTIGVPEEERAAPQTVAISVLIEIARPFSLLEDDITGALDYDLLCREVRAVAGRGERHLIETLAEDVAAAVLAFDVASSVEVEVEKFIIPDCDSVSVCVRRSK